MLVSLLVVAGTAAAQQIEISTCVSYLTGEEEGYLSADLTCTGLSAFTVAIGMGGMSRLDLRGFTLTSDGSAVGCGGNCEIVSSIPGGRIVGTGTAVSKAIDVRYGNSVTVENVTLSGFYYGIGDAKKATLTDSIVENMTQDGFDNVGEVRLLRSIVRNNVASGIDGAIYVVATDSEISGNGTYGYNGEYGRAKLTRTAVVENGADGLGCYYCPIVFVDGITRVAAVDSEISRNGGAGIGPGFLPSKVSLVRTIIADNVGPGVSLAGGSAKAKDSQITGNGAAGVEILGDDNRCKLVLAGSTVASNGLHGAECTSLVRARTTVAQSSLTANGTDIDCGVAVPCADLASSEAPGMRVGAICEQSYVSGSGLPGQSWGICSAD